MLNSILGNIFYRNMKNNKNKKGDLIMGILKIIAYSLVIIGALNWGLVGLFDYNLVGSLLGDMSIFSRIIYSTVGISALFLLVAHREMFSCIKNA